MKSGIYYLGNINIKGIFEEVKINIYNHRLIKLFNNNKLETNNIYFSTNEFVLQSENKIVKTGCSDNTYLYYMPYIYYLSILIKKKLKKIENCGTLNYILASSNYVYIFDNIHTKHSKNIKNVYNHWIIEKNYIYLKYNGELYINDILYIKNKNIKYLIYTPIDLIWKPDNHNNYPICYKEDILLYMKYLYIQYNIKVSKYLVCMIINFYT